ncbi:MAG TPA: RNA polymerase subunit sigma [Cytophagales bacterium]|nr:RNA polymerase subunit sigma [Cytophagales bacterium]HAA17448.1 RNA polymerase subunit sigma [Cytophagales bacterium]HAP62418.1 RNA polymerase subunit sigma [Cytophagales bacterium]
MHDLSDEVIMDRVLTGALNELTELFDRYQSPIYNYLVKQCRDRELAADLCQSVFERVIKYRRSFHADRSFKSWIYQIARNLLKDHWKKNQALVSDYTDLNEIEGKMQDGQALAEERERNEALYEVMDQLSEERKELLVLSKFQGLKYEEISEITGMSVAAIKVNIHRAVKQMRALYFATT